MTLHSALSTQHTELEVPLAVVVRCPLVGFRLRAVAGHCPGCEHFKGVADRFPGSPLPFARRYNVRCAAEPQNRELFEVEA